MSRPGSRRRDGTATDASREGRREIAAQMRELGAFIEANPDLHRCSILYLLSRLPEHLVPLAAALDWQDRMYGTGSGGSTPIGVLGDEP